MAEVHEVGPPSTRVPEQSEFSDQAAPTFRMSPEGQALRAQLDAQAGKSTTAPTGPIGITQLTPAERAAREAKTTEPAPTVTDPDSGDKINLLDGTKESGPAPSSEIVPEL